MSKIKTYLKNLDVQYLSLVDKGANNRELIYKSTRSTTGDERGATESFRKHAKIIKQDEDKQLIYCTVYAPDEADAHGDGMTADEIEKAAHHFLKAGRTSQVDKQHDEDPDEGHVVESFVLKGADERFPDEVEGAWVVAIKVVNEDTWNEIKKGEITGVSLQGLAVKEEVAEKGFMQRIEKMFERLVSKAEGEKVEKGFNERLQMRALWNAIHALSDELYSVMHDEKKSDKKASINEVLGQFSDYVENLESNINKQFTPMSTEEERNEQPDKALLQKIEELAATVTKVTERLETIEKSAPGRQSADGQDEPTQTQKSKGLPIFGA